MSRILIFDTETSGMVQWRAPIGHPGQPHIVQLAAILSQEDGKELSTMNVIVRPDGWEIPPELTEIHGISQERALDEGITLDSAMRAFSWMVTEADILVAHNLKFDAMMLQIEELRRGKKLPTGHLDYFCTMEASTPVCKIPSHRGYKWPKLIEAYIHFFGHEFEGAHDAVNDVRACRDIYFKLTGGD